MITPELDRFKSVLGKYFEQRFRLDKHDQELVANDLCKLILLYPTLDEVRQQYLTVSKLPPLRPLTDDERFGR